MKELDVVRPTLFSSDMLSMLQGVVGQTFLQYECAKDDVAGSTYGNIRLYFSDHIIDLSNEERFCPELNEDIACFSCALVSANSPFEPAVVADTETTVIGGMVHGVEIIEDKITINHGETVIAFDSALVFKTDAGDYMFARMEWFSEVILIAYNESYDTLFPVKKVMESWENDGENRVAVIRSHNQL